jgi:regulator of sigma E protease
MGMAFLNILYVVVAVIVLFGAAVFVHEFGHYWMARHRRMVVEEFAIGFGPLIRSWTRNGVKFSLRWIPAGGYVKLPQMITSPTLEGRANGAVPPASPGHKILVAFAGPLMNLVFAFILATIIFFVGLPILVNPSVIGRVDPDSPEGRLGVREGDRIVMVNDHAVKSWQDVAFETVTARTNVLPVVIERNGERKTYYLTAKESPLGGKWLDLDPREHPVVGAVEKGMPASAAGLKRGDKILSVNGIPVPSQERMIEVISGLEGKPCEVVFERGNETRSVTVTPRFDAVNKRARIGIVFSEGTYEVKRPGPLPWVLVQQVVEQTWGVISALIHTRETGVGAKDLSGPIGIFAMLAVYVKTDYRLALNFLVLLNVNLVILNLLPVPVLDGGHILMAIIEKIRRRPLNVKLVEYTTTAFAVVIISFMLYIAFFDIKRWPLFRAMFKSEAQIEQAAPPAGTPPAPAP